VERSDSIEDDDRSINKGDPPSMAPEVIVYR
jgi:hypothetical protein